MPTSMPTMRATTSSALAMPCTASAVAASSAALTGASARPKPRPPSTSGTVASASVRLVSPHEEADRKCPPGGRGGERSTRDERFRRDPGAQPEEQSGDRRADQQPRAGGGEDRDLRVGRGEREDDAG